MARSTLMYLIPHECNQGLRYYPFMTNSDIFNGGWITLDDSSDRVYVPNKTEEVNLSDFNMITIKNKSKH